MLHPMRGTMSYTKMRALTVTSYAQTSLRIAHPFGVGSKVMFGQGGK